MFSKTRLTIAIVCSVLMLAFCLPEIAQARKASYEWKVGTLAPRNVGWAKQVEEVLMPALDRITNKDLNLRVYWGGVMGDDEDAIKKMRIDQLQAGGLTASGAILILPDWAVVEIPFLFNSYDEVDFVKPKMFDRFDRLMEERGFKLVVWIDQDFDQIYSVRKALETPEDFRGVRFVAWYGPLEERVLELLGARPIPINVPEVTASVRSGIADANIAPAIWMVGAQMYSVSRFVNTMNIRYAPALIVVNNKAYNELPKAYQDGIIAERWELTDNFVAGTRRDNEKSLEAMIRYGMKKADITPANLARFQQILEPVGQEMVGRLYSQELLDELKGYLKEYRSIHSN
jgi:TRAP-type C4-dicarboxylate transport system substrate-binding protein